MSFYKDKSDTKTFVLGGIIGVACLMASEGFREHFYDQTTQGKAHVAMAKTVAEKCSHIKASVLQEDFQFYQVGVINSYLDNKSMNCADVESLVQYATKHSYVFQREGAQFKFNQQIIASTSGATEKSPLTTDLPGL